MMTFVYRLQARRRGASRREHPAFGYGRGGRPLWSVRDRDAESIRKTLRRAGLREWTDGHAGFAVESDGSPFYVAFTIEKTALRDVKATTDALVAHGCRVVPDPGMEPVLQVWIDRK